MVFNTDKTNDAGKKLARQVSDNLRAAALRASGLSDRLRDVNSQLQILFMMVRDLKKRVDEMEKNRDNPSAEER